MLAEAEKVFLAARPDYEMTRALDALRASEFSRLDEAKHVYLDYAGSGLYAASQVRRHAALLGCRVLGNPHSANPASAGSHELVECCQRRILEYFRAPSAEYAVIFTANASQALKLVGESFPFEAGGRFVLTDDNHNSVNGIREYCRARGAERVQVPIATSDMRVAKGVLEHCLDGAEPGRHHLLAYPAQSNFSGVQHPLEWVQRARACGYRVLLDAAGFVPTNRLDLSIVHPDFVAVSFYKMFGYPTGVGALIARRESLRLLRRPWFAGGTVEVASVRVDRFVRAADEAAFEDGTVDFAGIPALVFGLDLIEAVGIETIHERVRLLTGWLMDELMSMEHRNGRPLVRLHGPTGTERRGGTIAFSLQDAAGRAIDPYHVEPAAAGRNISLRTGCFCNPGAGETALGLTRADLERFFDGPEERLTYNHLRHGLAPRAAGVIRVSLGLVTNLADVRAFLECARTFLS